MVGFNLVTRGWGNFYDEVVVERESVFYTLLGSLLPPKWVFSGLKGCLWAPRACCHPMPVLFWIPSHHFLTLMKVRMEITY